MFCEPYPDITYLLFSAYAPKLLYYSHFTAIIVSLLLSGFILFNNRKNIAARILAVICFLFSLWTVADLFIWTQTDARIIMYLWSFWFTILSIIFLLSFYFLFVFIKKRDISFGVKLGGLLLVLPIIVFSSTPLNLQYFDVYACNAIEGTFYIYYTHILSLIIFISAACFGLWEYIKARGVDRKQVLFASLGILLFLAAFSVATYIASILNLFQSSVDTFSIEQYGYFGITIFIGFLTYLIVQYKAFNVKLIAAQALVAALIILIGSQFFFIQNDVNKILNSITLVLSIGFGFLLVRSVMREVTTREKLQVLSDNLQVANTRLLELDKQKTEFISFATHQIRSPLASMRGNVSMILEGDFGVVNGKVKEIMNIMLVSIKTLASVVEDYLNVSRIELGTMKYDMKTIDFKYLLQEVMNEQKPNIEAKGLSYSVSVDDNDTYMIKADLDKFKQVLMNIVDNSVKYTATGSLVVAIEKNVPEHIIRFTVTDTGVGISPNVMPKLFRKFSRAENANEANIHGTGLGLYIAKEIVTAHGGKIWAESEGEGKGSQFIVEMPEVFKL